MIEVRMEDHFWQGDGEAVLTTWYVDDGDHVDIGDTIADIMMEKSQIEIEAPASGIIRLRAAPEQPLRKGDTIAVIET